MFAQWVEMMRVKQGAWHSFIQKLVSYVIAIMLKKNTQKINHIKRVFSIYHVCCHNSFFVLYNLILHYLSWDGVIYVYSAPLCPFFIDIMIIFVQSWYKPTDPNMAIFCVFVYSIEYILWPLLSINPGTLDTI